MLQHLRLELGILAMFPLPQGLSSPMLRCPSQRLLDRIVRRYAEVPDAGSIYMDHLTDRDKLRLLYTLAVNSHPILLQVRATLPQLQTPPHDPSQANPHMRCVPAPVQRTPSPGLCQLPGLQKACFFHGVGWLKPGRVTRCSLHQSAKLGRDREPQVGYCTRAL